MLRLMDDRDQSPSRVELTTFVTKFRTDPVATPFTVVKGNSGRYDLGYPVDVLWLFGGIPRTTALAVNVSQEWSALKRVK